MAQNIADTFTTVRGRFGAYNIAATDPKAIYVDLQPFIWLDSSGIADGIGSRDRRFPASTQEVKRQIRCTPLINPTATTFDHAQGGVCSNQGIPCNGTLHHLNSRFHPGKQDTIVNPGSEPQLILLSSERN